jgi:hypothetical protein
VVAAIKHFHYMLKGRSFIVFTDHKTLVGALSRGSDPWTSRQQYQLLFIAEVLTQHSPHRWAVQYIGTTSPSAADGWLQRHLL